MKLKSWLKELPYTLLQGSLEMEVDEVVYDSRKAAPGTVFVCMRGANVDSHTFIPDVVEKGAPVLVVERVLKEIPFARLNGHPSQRLSNNANFAFQFIEGESMLIMLDMEGICGSSGSACTSGSMDPSHVLLAIGLPHEIAHGSLRLTLSAETTMEQIDFTVDCLKKIVERLRSMSPLYDDYIKKHPQQ